MKQADVMCLPEGLYPAEQNLYLQVGKRSRSWIFSMTVKGRQIKRGLGSAGVVSLSEARSRAERLRFELRYGDGEEKKETVLFKDIYKEVVETKARVKKWKNQKHQHQWVQTIEDYALPTLGGMAVSEVTREDVLKVLLPIWEEKPETASRLRARLEAVFGYAIRRGWREKENPARWKEGLEYDLPSRRKVQTVEHHEAPTLAELQEIAPRLLRSVSGRAVLFGALTASRVSEFIPAKWSEIDYKIRAWIVPAERRKDGRPYPHRVPLSPEALTVLERSKSDDEWIFPGKSDHHLHLETPRRILIKALHRPVTMHGCRSTFRDWCAETGKDPILAEKALMHTTGTEVTQAYQRSDLLEQRRPLMNAWAKAVMSKCNKL